MSENPSRALWTRAKKGTKVIERLNTADTHVYADLEWLLGELCNKLIQKYDERAYGYLIAVCPTCHGILGQMACSANLICLKCGREFELKEFIPTKKH